MLGAVYDYWAKKRAMRGKPLLRKLQQPPTAADPNPFTVFRQREGKTRPQTRRRRENDEASLQRMQELRESMEVRRLSTFSPSITNQLISAARKYCEPPPPNTRLIQSDGTRQPIIRLDRLVAACWSSWRRAS